MRMLFVAAIICVSAAQAPAQYPGTQYPTQVYPGLGGSGYQPVNPGNVMPNIYNPANQPLSPYLNLLRGGNPGVNYYYGVRPGTLGGAGRSGGAPFVAGGGNRPLFFPQLAAAPDPFGDGSRDPDTVLPPAGHPITFNNTMGYFPSPFGQAGGSRSGLAGLGAARPAGRR